MGQIDLKRFVDINIRSRVLATHIATRDTIALYTPEHVHTVVGDSGQTIGEEGYLVESEAQARAEYTTATAPETLKYLEMFYKNGGQKCLVIENKNLSAITAADIKALNDEYIIVGFVYPAAQVSTAYPKIKELATAREADPTVYGINEKILLARTEVADLEGTEKNIAVKYSAIPGAELTIAAYLANINVNYPDVVYDYAFTKENIEASDITTAQYDTIISQNCNVDVFLANAVRNLGGNLKNGEDLVNGYCRILLHQTLTDRLVNLLTTKLKDSTGVSRIYAAITQELDKYLRAGYLSTDKIWDKDTLRVARNGVNYTIIEKGTPLLAGFHTRVLPFAALTEEERAAHEAPPIYVIIADQYGIRVVTINGEVI